MRRPKYVVGKDPSGPTIVARGASEDVPLGAAVMANLVFRTNLGIGAPMLQIGGLPSKDAPGIFGGVGLRFFARLASASESCAGTQKTCARIRVPDACALARTTRALFRTQRKTLQEYPGEALGYRVLEEWAALKIGAAILPKSKVTSSHAYRIKDGAGRDVTIAYEAVWIGALDISKGQDRHE